MVKSNNVTHYAIRKAISINDVVNVRINCPPDDLQCSDAFILVNDPWFVACTEKLLIRRNELLIPVIIIMYAAREVEIGVLFPVLGAFNAGLIGTTHRRRYYGGGPSNFDNQL
jgi:hypothetical protein